MPESRTLLQEQVADVRRNHILDAATKVFAKRGFHRTTIRDVSQAAGVADGTIYNYFANKTALLMGILNRLNETERRDEDLALTTDMDLRMFMRHYIEQRLTVMIRDLDVFQVILSEVLVNPELRDVYVQQIVAPTFALAEIHFTRLAEAGKISAANIALKLRVVSATFLGLLMLRVMNDPQLDAKWDELPDLMTSMILDGLMPIGGL